MQQNQKQMRLGQQVPRMIAVNQQGQHVHHPGVGALQPPPQRMAVPPTPPPPYPVPPPPYPGNAAGPPPQQQQPPQQVGAQTISMDL